MPAAKAKVHQVLGASVGLLPQLPAKEGSPFDLGSLLLILGCGIAVICFSIALIPASSVPWRPVAIFISDRQIDLTLSGLLLLVATLAFYFMSGP